MHTLQRTTGRATSASSRTCIQRAVIVSSSGSLDLREVWIPRLTSEADDSTTALVDIERRHITHVLDLCQWRIEGIGGAANLLALKSSTLRSRMAKLGIVRPPR